MEIKENNGFLIINNRITYIILIIVAASTSFGTGFYADLTLEAETTETKSERQTQTNLASQIKAGKNITLLSGKDIIHKGSITIAMEGDINYKAGQNIEIIASKDTDDYKSDTETKKASVTIGSTNPVAPATDSIGGDIGYSEENQQTNSETYNNSQVIAEKGAINITTGASAKVAGANLFAENIKLTIGSYLDVESKQNLYESYGNSNAFNLGYNTADGGAIGGGYGKNNTNRLWTDIQTSIIGTNSLNLNVDGATNIIGALIANINNGVDTGNLFIKTDSLNYANLKDYDTSQESGFNINLSGIKTEKNNDNKNHITGSAQIGVKNKGQEKEGETKATIGAGAITIANNSDITALNREIAQTQTITKGQITAALDLDASLDLRLLSESGRQEILREIISLPQNINQIGKGLTNNIISQSIKNAITDDNKNIIDAVSQYISDDKKIALIQADTQLTQALNGLTNIDPLYLQYILQNAADIAGTGDGFAGDLQLYALINSGKGYSYLDTSNAIIGLNTLKTDIANSGETINVLFHETTNYADHSQNEQTAINRGNTAEAIWTLKNFEKENANKQTTENWNKEYADDPVILYGNLLYNIADPNNILLFKFGKRPLGKPTWLEPPTLMNTLSDISDNLIIDYLNLELSHEHGFFEDGSGDNIGFGDEGRFPEDPNELVNLGYRYEDKYYDDDIMREALKNVKDSFYSSIINNCQDWADRLRKEYKKLEKER